MQSNIKAFIRNTPVVGPLLNRAWKKLNKTGFQGSATYWENNYQTGGNSGDGSYGKAAEFKASVINHFVRDKQVASLVEFGSGDGNQLTLAQYPHYTGIDVSRSAIELCRRKFAGDSTKVFYTYEDLQAQQIPPKADCAMSLDVIYHLIESEVFQTYLKNLFAAAERYVIIYSSNFDQSKLNYFLDGGHVRHRNVTSWVAQNEPQWRLTNTILNPLRPEGISASKSAQYADFFFFEKQH